MIFCSPPTIGRRRNGSTTRPARLARLPRRAPRLTIKRTIRRPATRPSPLSRAPSCRPRWVAIPPRLLHSLAWCNPPPVHRLGWTPGRTPPSWFRLSASAWPGTCSATARRPSARAVRQPHRQPLCPTVLGQPAEHRQPADLLLHGRRGSELREYRGHRSEERR